jgi:outer membrane protein, heavy metal efflux system
VRTGRETLLTARSRALHAQNVLLPLRTRIVEQTQLQYNAMQVGIFQLLLAKREQIAAARQYIETLRDYWLARLDLGTILSGQMTDIGSTAQRAARAAGMPGAQRETGGH